MKLRLLRPPIKVLAMAGWLFPVCLFAADPTATFDAANKLYEEGKYAEAATAYEKLIQ